MKRRNLRQRLPSRKLHPDTEARAENQRKRNRQQPRLSNRRSNCRYRRKAQRTACSKNTCVTGATRSFHSYFVSIVRSNHCKRFGRGPNPGKTNSAFLPSGAVRGNTNTTLPPPASWGLKVSCMLPYQSIPGEISPFNSRTTTPIPFYARQPQTLSKKYGTTGAQASHAMSIVVPLRYSLVHR